MIVFDALVFLQNYIIRLPRFSHLVKLCDIVKKIGWSGAFLFKFCILSFCYDLVRFFYSKLSFLNESWINMLTKIFLGQKK